MKLTKRNVYKQTTSLWKEEMNRLFRSEEPLGLSIKALQHLN